MLFAELIYLFLSEGLVLLASLGLSICSIFSIGVLNRSPKITKLSIDAVERKETGAYYTPEDVVEYIVKNTVGEKQESA